MIEEVAITCIDAIERGYEWVSARVEFAIDPTDAGSARIADIGLVAPGRDGLVRFGGDLFILRPRVGGSRRAMVVVPNRGHVAVPFGIGPILPMMDSRPPLNDSWLIDEGWTVAFPGWQWDVPRPLASIDVPNVDVEPGW